MIYPVLQIGVIQEAEVIWASAQRLVIAAVLTELGKIGIEVSLDNCPGRAGETTVNPTRVSLCTIGGKTSDCDLIYREAITHDSTVSPVAEAQLDCLAYE